MQLLRLADGYVQEFSTEEAKELLKRNGEFQEVQKEVNDGKTKRTPNK